MNLLGPLLAAAAAAQPIAYPAFPANHNFTAVARWLERESGVSRRDLVTVRDELAWTRTASLGNRAAGEPTVMRVEAVGTEGWKLLGGRSAVVFLDADCEARRAAVRSAEIYAASNLLGEVRRGVEPSALPTTADTLSAIAIGLCGAPPALTAALAAASESAAAPAPAAVRRESAPRSRSRAAPPPAAAAPAAAPPVSTRPTPAPPVVALRPIPEASPQGSVAAVAAVPAPVQEPRARPAPPAPRAVAKAPPASPPAPAAPAAAPPPQGPAPTVQIGAFGSSASAMAAFGALVAAEPKLLSGKLQRLEPVPVQTGVLYRAVLTGFASHGEAEAFCRTLTAAGRPCVVRSGP